MEQADFFQQALVYLLAAVISVPLTKRLGLGSVLGYLLAGIIIGPFVLGFIGTRGEDVMHFAEFGVVMMLFLIGLELKPSLLWEMRRSIFGLGGLQLGLSAILLGSFAILLGLDFRSGLVVGLTLALSSTAIVLQTLDEKGLMKQSSGQASFSVLLFQDISVVPILALIPLMVIQDPAHVSAGHGETRHLAGHEITGWFQVILMLSAMSTIVVVGHYLARAFFRNIAQTGLREIFTATALLLIIAIAMFMEYVGLSPALGAFLAGVVLSDNEYRHELEADIEPFKGLLLGLFFISVGAGINFRVLAERPVTIIALLFALTGIKFLVLWVLASFFNIKGAQRPIFAFALSQGGEFAFVLISFSVDNKLITDNSSDVLFLVVALSMALTPLLLLINDRLLTPRFFPPCDPSDEPIDAHGHKVIIAGFDKFGVGVGRFLRANGFQATVLDDNPDNIKVLRKFGFEVYYGDASRPDLLAAAGAKDAKVLVVAAEDKHQSMKIVSLAKRYYPHLKILARATDLDHVWSLMREGVDGFQRDNFNSALELGVRTLTHLGFNHYRAYKLGSAFRQHNRKMIRKLYKDHQEDKNTFLSDARLHAQELEELLQAGMESSPYDFDCPWDIHSMREEAWANSSTDGPGGPNTPGRKDADAGADGKDSANTSGRADQNAETDSEDSPNTSGRADADDAPNEPPITK